MPRLRFDKQVGGDSPARSGNYTRRSYHAGMGTPRKVLVTGSAGRIGRATVRALAAAGHHVTGLDRRPTPGLPPDRGLVGDVTDPVVLAGAVAGVDCVYHLAACPDDDRFPRGTPPDDGDNFLSDLVPANVVGPYHLLEAVRKAGVKRVVLASTGQTVDGHLEAGNVPVTATAAYRPRYLYACTKVFLEALGQVYAKEHGLTVLMVRFGWCPRDAGQVAEIAADPDAQDVFLSPADAGRFAVAAVEAGPLPGYAVVYAASQFTHRMLYDDGPARSLLRFTPHDQWPAGADDFQ
jgi:NAD(P)-dependent dehydrogenase (short-subunit alcohol dehydrogenase family)